MSKGTASIKRMIAAGILGAVSEGALWTMNASYGRFFDNGNALGVGMFMFHVPGMLITHSLGLPGGSHMADRIIISGAIQLFLIYWGVMAIWTRVRGRHNAEPDGPPNGGPAGGLGNSARSGGPPSVIVKPRPSQ